MGLVWHSPSWLSLLCSGPSEQTTGYSVTLAGLQVLSEGSADMLTQVTARTQVVAATFCIEHRARLQCVLDDLSARPSMVSMTKYPQVLTSPVDRHHSGSDD